MTIIGDKIRAFRQSLRMTQQELANHTGWAVSTITRYEAGRLPQGEELMKLARVADAKFDDLAIDLYLLFADQNGLMANDAQRIADVLRAGEVAEQGTFGVHSSDSVSSTD